MAETTIVDGSVYITTGSVSGNTITHDANKIVEIYSAVIEFGYINKIGDISFKGKNDRPDDLPPLIQDLKKIQKVITVTGVLDDEANLRSITKRNNLINMGEFDDALTLVWGIDGSYRTLFSPTDNKGVFILKINFKETAGIIGVNVTGDSQPMTKREVTAQFITGQDI